MVPKTPTKGTKPRKATQKPNGEALMSSAELMQATGYSRPAIANFVSVGLIKSQGRAQWPILTTLGALFRKLRERADDSGAKDRARKNKSEADQAELDALDAAKKLCPMSSAKLFWSDARIEVRQVIERAQYLTPVQRTKLLAELATLRTKQPENEK